MSHDFDQFKENLENRREPPFEESLWLDMEKRLDQQSRRGTSIIPWWWVGLPLLALLVGTNAYWLWASRQTTPSISQSTIIVQKDTIYKTQTIFQRDTIYKTTYREIIVRENTPVSSYQNPTFVLGEKKYDDSLGSTTPLLDNMLSMRNGFMLNQPSILAWKRSPQSDLSEDQARPNSTGTGLVVGTAFQPSSLASPLWPVDMGSSAFSKEPDLSFSVNRKRLVKTLSIFQPVGLQLGFKAGAAFPFQSEFLKAGTVAGLEALMEFRAPLQMWINASYYRHPFLSKRMDDDNNKIGVPQISPPNDELLFVEAETTLKSFQYSVGLQYQFDLSRKGRIRGRFGLGYGAVKLLPYELVYDFEDPITEIEWNFDETIEQQQLTQQYALFRLGFAMSISKRWDLLLQSNWRSHWGDSSLQTPNLLGIQTGLMYRL